MAKYETRLRGNFNSLVNWMEQGILRGSESASLEDGSDFDVNGVRCSVRVFERYSMIGSNRVSLTIVIFGYGEELVFTAIAAGGSQAVLFKINTIGEETFLQKAIQVLEEFRRSGQGY